MDIQFSSKFKKLYRKTPRKIRSTVNKRLIIFKDDPFNPLLNNHALRGEFQGFRSINITGDWRALFRQTTEKVVFDALGTHSELYE